jgi:integrase
MPKACLTPEVVEAIDPPTQGEIWIADTHLKHFGLRTWAGKKGGNCAYAIRLRDQFGILVRETFRPDRDHPYFRWEGGWDKPLGYFLEAARAWARDRIAINLGLPTSADRQARAWRRRKAKVLSTTIGDAMDRRLAGLRRRSRDHLYLDQIRNLVALHIPDDVLRATFQRVPVRRLADSISNRGLSYGNVKVLRAFVGAVFKEAAGNFGPLHWKLESIQRICARNLDLRKAPPYPQILRITEADYRRFFQVLEADPSWRQALAIRLYFDTGAKLQQILRARWSDIVDGTWFPFLPDERRLWYESRQRLGSEAAVILGLIEDRHRVEGLTSPYLFPSPKNQAAPIKTVQRHWNRYCATFGWRGLPISHVVLRHRPRDNPSYSLFFYRAYLGFDKRAKGVPAVSKVGKRRKDFSISSATYR